MDINSLVCSECKNSLTLDNEKLYCKKCSAEYVINNGIPNMIIDKSPIKDEIRNFWDKGAKLRYILENSGANVLIAHKSKAKVVGDALSDGQRDCKVI